MGAHHGLADAHVAVPGSPKVRRLLLMLLAPLVAATVIAVVLLWPSSAKPPSNPNFGHAKLVTGTVAAPAVPNCPQGQVGAGGLSGPDCTSASILITSGPDAGTTKLIEVDRGPGNPVLNKGDKIVLGREVDLTTGNAFYSFADYQRKSGLLFLALSFVVLVLFVARWRGLGAIAGLVVTWAMVTKFLIPAILEGSSPVAVALAGAAVTVTIVLYIAHGFNVRTTTAVIGTLVSLGLVGLLTGVSAPFLHLTGFASEEAVYVQQFTGASVNVASLLLAGFIIGSIGVLNDTTVTQASAVWEIHMAQPGRSWSQLYGSGMRVGRDHIASTVYTLVLAYTGAALPLLILFSLANRPVMDVLTGEVVADELVRTLIGSIGLVASVPITTALAAWVSSAQSVPRSEKVIHSAGYDMAVQAEQPAQPTEEPRVAIESEPAVVVKTEPKPAEAESKADSDPPNFERKMGRMERKFWEDD